MKNVNVLTGTELSNTNILLSYWSILYENKQTLKNFNININFYKKINKEFLNGDVLILSSRYFYKQKENNVNAILKSLNDIYYFNKNILWFDLRDSAGTTQFEVMPYVKKYLKGQIYKNNEYYLNYLYGGRFYTDYYFKNNNIKDKIQYEYKLLEKEDINKIFISWNLGTLRYDLRAKKNIYKFFLKKNFLNSFLLKDSTKYISTNNLENRKYRVHALLNTKFERETVAYQRNYVINLIKNKNNMDLINKKFSKKNFLKSLSQSKMTLSLYGWGEICYRDWESIINGTPFIKPDMSNIETWPNIYESNKTYYPIKLNFADLEETINYAASHIKNSKQIVENAQKIHKSIRSEIGMKQFCEKFKDIITLK